MPIHRINKILIANRGEIAVRIIQACREMDIISVAVYSTADQTSLHVELADEAVCIGDPEAASSYLNIDKIIAVARKLNVQAIHPGYGFLAENPVFADACKSNGIIFIGPDAQCMSAVASKDTARSLVQGLEVPTIPGLEDLATYSNSLVKRCEAIGYPLLLKAAAGGGGLGMRIVESSAQLEDAFKSVKREAKQAFGDDGIIVEKYLGHARHIEVQILADKNGNCVHLHERDCSIQRRRQKIVEESPARGLALQIKQQLCDAAVSITKHINYSGAGTIEFLVDGDHFYFLEMNTRLQVEHGVTEAVTGIDIVQWQIRIAEGATLTLQQDDIVQRGHAIECRLCAEDPALDFIPASGVVSYWQGPIVQRCDTGIRSGSEIGIYYDSLLAKVVSFGDDFSQANRNLQTALAQCALLGLKSNLHYLRQIVSSQPWCEATIDTSAVEKYHSQWSAPLDSDAVNQLISAAIVLLCNRQQQSSWPGEQHIPQQWQVVIVGSNKDQISVESRQLEQTNTVTNSMIDIGGDDYHTSLRALEFMESPAPANALIARLEIEINQHRVHVIGLVVDNQVSLHCDTLGSIALTIGSANSTKNSGISEDKILAPMPAKIVAISVQIGEKVSKGQELLLLESMKMETRLTASRDATIKTIDVSEGELVESGNPLIEFESEIE